LAAEVAAAAAAAWQQKQQQQQPQQQHVSRNSMSAMGCVSTTYSSSRTGCHTQQQKQLEDGQLQPGVPVEFQGSNMHGDAA
jgi:hypothetical protein